MAQRVGRDIAVFFHDRGTRRERVVSSTPRPQFTPGKDPVPIVQEAGWATETVWRSAENLALLGFDLELSSPSSAAIPTKLPGPDISFFVINHSIAYLHLLLSQILNSFYFVLKLFCMCIAYFRNHSRQNNF